ncbi:hypothetical protein [Bacillus sp. EAC]|uniref:hypothetical protein n=1 Tax=Bacillus sp. EAC TaxID=1978338 RepID=UPI000B442AAA|nr:hypothetical protein [Bacillus sp. EAC]
MRKLINRIIVFFLIVNVTACSINQNKESFRVFDDSQSFVSSKEIKSDDDVKKVKKLLKDTNWSKEYKLRPDRESSYTIKLEKQGQTEVLNNYKVWLEVDKAIIIDHYNQKYGTLDGANFDKLKDLLYVEIP